MTTIIRRKYLGKVSIKGIADASKHDITTVRNDAELPEDDVYIRWGCTSTVPYTDKVINSAKAIHRVADKAGFRRELNKYGTCPTTWFDHREVPWEAGYLKDGVIVRTNTHAQGKGLWHCKTGVDTIVACDEAGEGYYINKYIPKIAEFRVFVMQGRVVWVCHKNIEDKSQVAWNHKEGSVFQNVKWGSWNLDVCRVAVEAMNISMLHFGGVDVILDKDFKAYVLEINSAPSLPYPYRQGCVAKAFDWMLDSKDYSLVPKGMELTLPNKWQDYIHPALV